MKKIYSLLICSVVAVSAFGQARISSPVNANPVSSAIIKTGNPTVMANDTLWPPSFGVPLMCDTAPVYYQLDAVNPVDSGYAFGNNVYGETQCAQKYYGTGTVDEVLVWYGHVAGTSGSTTVNIYSINPITKGPSATVLGTSVPILTGALTTTVLASYTFTPSVAVSGQFAAAAVFPTSAGDTVAVVSTVLGCATADSLSWENFPAFGGWLHTMAAFGVNLDFFIIPVGTLLNTTGINEYSANGLSLLGAYPNPASDFTNIKYSTSEAGAVSVEVFDLTGRVIHHSSENLSAGTHDIKISLKDVSAGKYYYTIKTGGAQLTSKFVVAK